MPKPNKNESKQDYLKRCTTELIEQENRDADQAFAMCNAFWDEDKSLRAPLSLNAPIQLSQLSDKSEDIRQFFITAYTGQEYQPFWGNPIIFEISGMKTKKKMPILREHTRDRIVGQGESFIDDDKKIFMVKGNFSKKTQDAKEVLALADEGYPWQASIGVSARKIQVLENEKAKSVVNGKEVIGPLEIWTESNVDEVSFVTLGADDNTAAITLSEPENKKRSRKVSIELIKGTINNNITMEDESMSDETLTLEFLKEKNPELLADIEDKAFQAGKNEGVDLERIRIVELLEADADELETLNAIKNGIDAAEAYKQFYVAEKSKRAEGLKQLQQEATEPQGQEEPIEEQPKPEKTKTQLRREWMPQSGPAMVS